MKNKLYKLGIIGAGTIAETRIIPALAAIKEFEVAYVFDINEKRLDYIADTYSINKTASIEDLLAKDCDAVYIATPNRYHAQIAIQALKHDIAVLVEKPCANTLEAAETLLKSTREAKRPLLVGYMSKWNRNNQTAQRLVRENRIGELRSITATFGFFNQSMDAWRLFREQSGPGALADLGIYSITTALDMFDEKPLSCTAQAYPAGDTVWGDKFLSGRVDFPGGRWFQLSVSFLNPSCGYTMVGTEGVIHVEGSWAQSGEGEIVVCRGNNVEKIVVENINPYEEELKCLGRCLDGEKVPLFMSMERAIEDIRVMDALDRSAAQMGREIIIDRG